jgi:large subunit ribosomal protein L19e
MDLRVQRRLAASVLGCSEKHVWLDHKKRSEIKEAITKADIRSLVHKGMIQIKPIKGVSRARAKKRQEQRKKGRRKGPGTRKGAKKARMPKKDAWMGRVRLQREFLKDLRDRERIKEGLYRQLYNKIKGGFFRSKRHVKLYLEEQELFEQKKQVKKKQ